MDIKASPKEIAALVVASQERRKPEFVTSGAPCPGPLSDAEMFSSSGD